MLKRDQNCVVILLSLGSMFIGAGCANNLNPQPVAPKTSIPTLSSIPSSNSSSSSSSSSGSTGASGSTPTTTVTTPTIQSFSPSAGTYTTLPTQVQVNFSETAMDSVTITSVAYWTLNCGWSSQNPTQVTLANGVATITLPTVSITSANTQCILTASNGIQDSNRSYLSGNTSVTYNISAVTGASGSSGTIYVRTKNTYTLTKGVGSTTYGTSFSSVAPDGNSALRGFYLYVDSYVNQLTPIWENNYSPTNSNYYTTNGTTVGTPKGVYGALYCPDQNSRVIGVFGNAGDNIDGLGIICESQILDPSTIYYSPALGGTSDKSFNLTCPSGTFVTTVQGRAGYNLDAISLGCQ